MLWKPLCDTVPGETVRIRELCSKSGIRRRLLDMGLIPNTHVTIRKVAPMGDPIQIYLRGYELTLRRADAQQILLKEEAR